MPREYDNEHLMKNLSKVKLRERRRGAGSSRTLVFEVTPDVSESGSVNYRTIDVIHGPTQILAYQNTTSRVFNINAKLVSRTTEEATKNLARLNLLRSWRTPTFGSTSRVIDQRIVGGNLSQTQLDALLNNASSGRSVLGAPPAVLEMSAYSDASRRGHIYKVPTVITQLGITYPSDVDYIPTGPTEGFEDISIGVPMPTVMSLDVTLTESQSPYDISTFNLRAYRLGVLEGF